MALEVGKNRMEAIGEVQETADLITWYCDQMAEQRRLRPRAARRPADRLAQPQPHACCKPYGVWAVIAPFNFPFALAGGPIGAALVAGNTVVFKTASDTAWSGRLLMDVFDAAGLPPGVFNLVSGAGAEVGDGADARDPRWPASPSPARTRSAWSCCGTSPPGRGRAR